MRVQVQFITEPVQAQERAEGRDGHRHEDAEGQGPPFIQGRQNQEDKDGGEQENLHDADAVLDFLFLVAHVRIAVAHVGRHAGFKGFFQRLHGLGVGVALGGRDHELG